MRTRIVLPLLATATLAFPAAASASFPHVVAAGESLSSVAAADGLTVGQLAAANGLSPDAQLVSGSTLMIPPQGGTAVSTGTPAATADETESASTGEYVVEPGDTLSAIAARQGISVAQLAADNGLDPNGVLLAGSTIQLSGSSSGQAAPAGGTTSSAGGAYLVQPGDTLTAIAARAGVSVAQLAAANGLDPNGILLAGSSLQLSGSSSGTAEMVSTGTGSSASSAGGYIVQPGDTLSALAARAGISVSQLAAENGLDPNGTLLAGSSIALPGAGAPVSTASADGQPVGATAEGNPTSPPYPTPERVSASEVGSIASANGVPPSLAEAIGWQESGFNNDLVSTADARGVMQILPGTWDWIQRTLTPSDPLAPASAASNVRGGVLLLHSLLNSTGGNSAEAAAGYYQGLSSVQQNGLFPDTQNYVNSVMALESQFGGG
jgi:N-acetylmuramoyl-L-alanine amidase